MFSFFKKKKSINANELLEIVTSKFYKQSETDNAKPLSIIMDDFVSTMNIDDSIKEEAYKILQETFTSDTKVPDRDNPLGDEADILYNSLSDSNSIDELISKIKRIIEILEIRDEKIKNSEDGFVISFVNDNEFADATLVFDHIYLLDKIEKAVSNGIIKQVDIYKSIDEEKSLVSSFIYAMSKYGFIEKNTIKNRVIVKSIIREK